MEHHKTHTENSWHDYVIHELKKENEQKNKAKISRELPVSGFELGIPECEEIVVLLG